MRRFFSHVLVPVAAVAAIAVGAPAANATSFIACNDSPTRVCYDEVGPTGVRFFLSNAVQDAPIASVAAYLDVYRIPVGDGGVQVPCITPVVNGSPVDNCDRLGFELIQRSPLLSETNAALYRLEPAGSVYVCDARLTVLVANVGLNQVPILSACHEGLPQFSTK